MEDLCSDLMDESKDFDEFDEFLESFDALSPAFLPRPVFNSKMEDLCSDLMDESEDFDEFDEFLESFDAPRYFDFTAVDNSRPDSPSWFCARIGCNQNHEQVEAEALDRSFKHTVRAARAPALKRQKPPKPDRARRTPKYAHSAPAKPAASASVVSAASTRVRKQFALNKADCHMLTSNKGKKPDSTNSKDLVLSEMPNSISSICSISKRSSIVSEIPASSQTTHTESFENAMAANKENVPNTTCLEENCDKSNILQKDCGNQHSEREKSKRMTIPKPFKLLTNERRIQREVNLEKNINSEAKREIVSALRGRYGMKNNQIGKRVQKPRPTEATVARGKMGKLAENNLIKRKAQCQKPEVFKKELGEKSQEERVKGTSSKQSIRNHSLMAPKNAHSSLSKRNKVIKTNTCLPVKKSVTAQQAAGSTSVGRYGVTQNQIAKGLQNPQPGEARLYCGKSVRLAPTHLITSHTQSMKKKQIDKRVQNPHPREARLDRGTSVRLAQAKLITSHPQSQKSNQIDRRVPKPQASEAKLGHDKIDRLARAKLITSNPLCQMSLQSESNQVELGETSHEELVNVASSKQPRKTQSLLVSRNAHSSSSHGNKVITANSHSNEDPVKVASSKHPHKTQSLMAPWNANCSSSHGNKVFTENVHSQVEKPATGQGAAGSAIVSRDGIEAGLNLRKMAGDILMTETSQCGKAEINKEKSHKEVAKVASSFTSLIEARNASSSLTQVKKFMAGKETFSQWKRSATAQRLSTSAIRFLDGSKKIETGKKMQKSQPIEPKLAHSKMVRFVGGKSIVVVNSHCHKTGNKDKLREKSHKEVVIVGSSGKLNSPSPMATQSCTPHGDEAITVKGACSQGKRLAATAKDPKLHKIDVPAACLKKPEKAI